jgi:cobalt-zinc-cadmium efflux system outer membrane protein
MITPSTITAEKPTHNRFFVGVKMTINPVLLMAILLSTAPSFAATASEPLSLNKALGLTLSEHPELNAYAHQQLAFNGLIEQAGAKTRPEIGISIEDALGSGSLSGLSGAQSTVKITWLLDQEQIQSRIKAAKASSTSIVFAQEIKALDLGALTAKRFIESTTFIARLKLAKLMKQQSQEVLAAINARQQAGKSGSVENKLAQTDVLRRELDIEDLSHELKSSLYRLVSPWQGNAQDYHLVGDLFYIPAIGNVEQQMQKIKQHPMLKMLVNQQRIIQSEIELARIEAKPKWQFSTGVRRYETTDDVGLIAGVSIPWGVDERATGASKALSAKQGELQNQMQAFSQKLDVQLYVLLQEINHSQHVITMLQDKLIPLLEAASLESKQAYELGKLSYMQWNDVRQELFTSKLELLDAYQTIHLQHIEIQRLTGVPLSM